MDFLITTFPGIPNAGHRGGGVDDNERDRGGDGGTRHGRRPPPRGAAGGADVRARGGARHHALRPRAHEGERAQLGQCKRCLYLYSLT